jgi:hypothetical protein
MIIKKLLLVTIISIWGLCSSGQTLFEKGYFIDNKNSKVDCYINDNRWFKNPISFNYRLSLKGETKTANIADVKEFCIYNSSKFIRTMVDIDTSSTTLRNLSDVRRPLWKQNQIVFLRSLIEGEASLYYYTEGSYERFFYSCKGVPINQLVYKEYIYNLYKTAFNDSFRLQLYYNMRCPDSKEYPTNLKFNKNELITYFEDYNNCVGAPSTKTDLVKNKGIFSLSFSAGVAYSTMSVSKAYHSYTNVDFGGKLTPLFFSELEYIMPFNNNKWGIVVSPIYQAYSAEIVTDTKELTVDFSSVDLAVGLKHYFYLNNDSKLFAGCYLNSLLTNCFDSKIGYKVSTSKDLSYIDIERFKINLIFGAGFEYKRACVELRYFTNQDLLLFHPTWDSSYKKMTVTIGYKFLKSK